MNQTDQPVALLGIVAENATIDEIIQKILKLIEDYRKDLFPRYVATANVDFLTQVNSCIRFDSANQELMHILREAKMITVDGTPLIWLSSLLGSPIKERVTGIDLLPKLAEALATNKQSIFLLGGEDKTLKMCVVYLQALNPGIKIAGALHPKIYIEGEIQESNEERDILLAEQINRAAPDVLFINLGNPKQEIWFERIKHKLHVPVSIGVGGSFDLLTGIIPRAPIWMQKSGLEWLYRLFQEPGRLFKRYMTDFFKFPILTLPLIIYHNLNKLFYKIFYRSGKKISLRNTLLFISSQQTVAVVPLVRRINKWVAAEIKKNWDDLFSQDAVILDFKEVRHIDLEGLALLLLMWRRANWEKKQMFALNMSAGIRWLLRFHRLWDYIAPYVCRSPRDALIHFSKSGLTANFYDSVQQYHRYVIISFFGQLDHNRDFEGYMKKITPILFQKECILDLTYCTYIDNAGIAFLLNLKKNKPQLFNSLYLHGISKPIAQQLKLAKVDHLFAILPDLSVIFK